MENACAWEHVITGMFHHSGACVDIILKDEGVTCYCIIFHDKDTKD